MLTTKARSLGLTILIFDFAKRISIMIEIGVPKGIRTPVTAVKGQKFSANWCPYVSAVVS